MRDEPRWSELATGWWRALQPNEKHPDPAKRSGDRAALARLRRCGTVVEAASEPEALALARHLGATPRQPQRLENALLAAVVLAHVRGDHRDMPVARHLGANSCAHLLAADTIDERLIMFRRIVGLLDGRLHVPDLAHALLDWSEKTRIAWAFGYYNVPSSGADALPQPLQPTAGDAA